MAHNYKQGFFKPQNPKKYMGDPTNIVYRSGWEKRVMDWCDANPNIKQWSSEEIVIPYKSPVDDRDRKSTRLNSSHIPLSRMPSSA